LTDRPPAPPEIGQIISCCRVMLRTAVDIARWSAQQDLPPLPTCAVQQVGSYPGYPGRGTDAGKGARMAGMGTWKRSPLRNS